MSAREIHLELALGRRVLAKNGRPVGRLEEIRVDDDWAIIEYLIGSAALLERLSVSALSLFGVSRPGEGYRARWNQVDLTDPRRPRLTCPVDELARL
jgi:hypothetical protein